MGFGHERLDVDRALTKLGQRGYTVCEESNDYVVSSKDTDTDTDTEGRLPPSNRQSCASPNAAPPHR